MNIHQGHSHHRAPEEDTTGTLLAPRQQEFMLADWHVRPAHHCITDGQQTRQLEPRLMTLLCLLAARPGDVLNRDDLMDALWPRVVVNENSLTRAVSDLRRLLRDNGGTAFIETVPKKGYKLVAPIAGITGKRPPTGRAEGQTGTESGRPTVMQWLQRHAAALAAVNVTLALALVGSVSPLPLSPEGNAGMESFPAAGLTMDPVDSQDQEKLVDEILRERPGDVIRHDDTRPYLPTMTTARTSSPANAENTAGPAISPDGELVAFTRRTDNGSTLLIGSMLDSSDPLQVYSSQHRIDHLRWSPVGTALLFSVLPTASHAAMGKQEEGRLMLFDLQDLSVRELYRSGHEPDDTPARFNDALNIT